MDSFLLPQATHIPHVCNLVAKTKGHLGHYLGHTPLPYYHLITIESTRIHLPCNSVTIFNTLIVLKLIHRRNNLSSNTYVYKKTKTKQNTLWYFERYWGWFWRMTNTSWQFHLEQDVVTVCGERAVLLVDTVTWQSKHPKKITTDPAEALWLPSSTCTPPVPRWLLCTADIGRGQVDVGHWGHRSKHVVATSQPHPLITSEEASSRTKQSDRMKQGC